MTLVYIEGTDPWLSEYDACEKLHREIMEQLTLRDSESRLSQTFASLSANIRLRLKQYSNQIQQLKNKIGEAAKLKIITAEEAERRLRQVEQLQSKEVNLKRIYESRTNNLAAARTRLMEPTSSAFADCGTTNWGDDDYDDKPIDINVSVTDLKLKRDQLLQEQDAGLEELSKAISRQKQIAETIHTEVDQHNEIIDDLADHMERTDARLIDETRQVRTIDRKSNVCGYWVVIILLFGTILIVGFV